MKKVTIYIVGLLFGLILIDVHAQDHLNKKMMSSRVRDNDIFILLDSANILINQNPLEAYDYVEKAIELSITQKNKKGEAYAYLALGKINFQLNQYDLSIENYQKAINLFDEIDDQEGLYETNKLIGEAYQMNNQYDYSLNSYFSSLEQAKSSKKTDEVVDAKNRIANLYSNQGKYELSKKTYKEVLELEKTRNNKKGVIEAQDNIGTILLEEENPDEALEYYQASQSIAEEINDNEMQSRSLDNLGKAFRKSKKLDKELAVRQKSLELNTVRNDIPAQTKDNIEIARIYIQQDKEEEAIPYLEKGINLTEKSGNIDQKQEALKSLSTVYDKSGDYDKALKAYKDYVAVTDRLHQMKEQKILADLELVTSLSRKQQRVELLEKDRELTEKTIELLQQEQLLQEQEIKKKGVIIYSLIAGILVLFIASYFVYKSSRQKRIANQLLALKSLRSQMNPHFIFNALNSVNSFIAKSDERTANKYLSDFAKLMRLVMENSQYDFISLADEIAILELYIRLEHLRFEEKFDYNFEVDQSIDIEDFLVPPMLIQPYIENAVWHGLRYKEKKGMLNVMLTQQNGFLTIVVEDNGIGRVKSQEIKTKNQKENVSTGLKNIKARLNIINDVHKTKIRVSIEDLNPENETGTKVIIQIPKQDAEDEQLK